MTDRPEEFTNQSSRIPIRANRGGYGQERRILRAGALRGLLRSVTEAVGLAVALLLVLALLGCEKQEAPQPSFRQAVKQADLDRIRSLLDAGADVDTRNQAGLTPLHLAASLGHREVAEVLLDHFAKVDAETVGGWMPLHLAARSGHSGVTALLLARGADVAAETVLGLASASP